MRTLKRLALAAMLAILLVMSLHCIFTSRAYVRAMRHADLSARPLVSKDPPRLMDRTPLLGEDSGATADDKGYSFLAPRPSGVRTYYDAAPVVLSTTYEYRVTVRHWSLPDDVYRAQTYLNFDLWTDRRIVVTVEGTRPIASGYPHPDTPSGLGVANFDRSLVVPIGGNYFGWLARDLMWVASGGWLVYAVAALIAIGIRFRGIVRRGLGVVERGAHAVHQGTLKGAHLGKVLANRLDEKVEALNTPER